MLKKFTSIRLANETAWVARSGLPPRTSSLDNFDFQPEPGMLYVATRAISSRVNANHDGWPADELRKAYRTFVGRGVFVDHNNWDADRSRGVILDAKLHEDKLASGHDDVWVELLIEVDAQAFPRLASAILSGDIDSVSMGADVEFTICSVCGNKAHDVTQYCAHIPQMKGRRIEVEDKTAGTKKSVLCYEDCFGVGFFEISFVFDPADESALVSDTRLFAASKAAKTGSRRIQRHLRRGGEGLTEYKARVRHISKVAAKTAQSDNFADLDHDGKVRHLRDDHAINDMYVDLNDLDDDELDTEHDADHRDRSDAHSSRSRRGASKTADETLMSVPEAPDTLRDESMCPNCGAPDFDGISCAICGYEEAPEGLNDPETEPEEAAQLQTEQLDEEEPPKEQPQNAPGNSPKQQPPTKKKEPTDKAARGGGMSRLKEVARAKVADLPVAYDQSTAPATNVPQYGQPADANGQATAPPEPPVDSDAAQRAQQDQIDPRTLDVSEVQGPPGQSAVNEVGQQTQLPKQVQPAVSQAAKREEFLQKAETLARRAARFRRLAEDVVRVDVENLDEQVPVDVGSDAKPNLLAPTEEGNQLQLADRPETVNDGSETGYPIQNQDQSDAEWFNNVRPVAKKESEGARVLRIANFVDKRVELGLTPADVKNAEVAKFEALSDDELGGWIKATEEIAASQIKNAKRRVRVASSGSGRLPSLGEGSPRVAERGGVDDRSLDYLIGISG